MAPDWTPDPQEQQRQLQAAQQRAQQEEAMRRAEMERRIDAGMIDPNVIQPTGQPVQAGGFISRSEGGDPNKLQMSPEMIDALRRSGVE